MDSPEEGRTSPFFSPDEDKNKENSGYVQCRLSSVVCVTVLDKVCHVCVCDCLFSLARDSAGTGDESSYSSFSSFLKTDDSMKSSPEDADTGKVEVMVWDKATDSDEPPPVPVRKVLISKYGNMFSY